MSELRRCGDLSCKLDHVENCRKCMGFGFIQRPHGAFELVSAGESVDVIEGRFDPGPNQRFVPCNACGGTVGRLKSMTTRPAMFTIRRAADGAERTWRGVEYWHLEDDGQYHWNPWIWSEGNNSDDCNRRLDWLRAGNEPEPEDVCAMECTEGEYLVVSIVDVETGACLYSEVE